MIQEQQVYLRCVFSALYECMFIHIDHKTTLVFSNQGNHNLINNLKAIGSVQLGHPGNFKTNLISVS